MPDISIIVPVYNSKEYLAQCVDSILNQTFQNFEVILVDDGSKDRSGEICDAYAARDSRVRVIHKPNGGLVSARKAGALEATGTYVMFVDSDDYIGLQLVQGIADIISRYEPDVILFAFRRFADNWEKTFRTEWAEGLYKEEGLLKIRENLVCPLEPQYLVIPSIWSKAIKRELYTSYQMQVPDSISMGEDLAVTMPLLAYCESIYVYDCCEYYYRDNPDSISNTFKVGYSRQLRELISWLHGTMGDRYSTNIERYTVRQVCRYVNLAAKKAATYREFQELISDLRSKEIRYWLRNVRIPAGGTLVSKISDFLALKSCHLLYWILWNVKNGQKKQGTKNG